MSSNIISLFIIVQFFSRDVVLPPPSLLKGKILIKNKKQHHHTNRNQSSKLHLLDICMYHSFINIYEALMFRQL
jgi:hypothetical protein